MPDNFQELPGGLVGFRETPHEVFVNYDDINNYEVLNIDQVIIAKSAVDIELDSNIISIGKIIYIKNVVSSEINILGINCDIENENSIILKPNEAVTLVLVEFESGFNFLILGKYKIAKPMLDFFVEAGAPMESGDTQLQNSGFLFAPTVYIDGILLTYEVTTNRRYVSFNGVTKTITINNGGVNEGENVQIFT